MIVNIKMNGSLRCIVRTYAIVFTLFINNFAFCSFSPEELKSVSYEVDILQTPVKFGEEQTLPVLHMTSKYGQQYQCLLPQLEEKEELSERKDAASEESTDIKELLKPLRNGPCLSKAKDWWTYELCFGHYIKQYHIEDGKILGEVIDLGVYDSEFDWTNETAKEKFANSKQRYHSQIYTNGTKCDLTGFPRTAEVRFFCEKDAGDYIYRVDEPGTCSYILTVHTSTICSHPLLKLPLLNKAHSITCNPLLDEEQYSKYLKKINEEKQVAEEKRTQWLSDQQERLKVMKDWAKDNFLHLDEGEEMEKVSEAVTTAAKDTPGKLPNDQNPTENEVKTEVKDEVTEEISVPEEEKKVETADNKLDEVLDEGEEIFFQEYDKEIEKLKITSSSKAFAAVKEGIQKTYDSIISEAEDDLDKDLTDEDRDAVFSKLASTLNMLLEKLDKAEKDVAKATKELEKAKSVINTKKTEDSDEDDEAFDEDEIMTDEDILNSQESKSKEVKLKVVEDGQSQSAVLDDDKVHVRIRRLDRKALDPSGKLHEMDFAQRRKLELAVKEKLEKAGLDTGGRRIEVKIITAGFYDSEDGKDFHALSDEETNQFQSMIMAFLTGQQEAVQEMERHKKLEDNYKFVWEFSEAKSEEEE